MKDLTYLPNYAKGQAWAERHLAATKRHPVGIAISSWLLYALAHKTQFGQGIGSDYVLGDYWADWGYALLGLLNGDLGGMDGGTLDTILRDNLEEQGFDADTQKRLDR